MDFKDIEQIGQVYRNINENFIEEENVDFYDEILEYLIGEGYSIEESNQIMVALVDEGWGSAIKSGLGAAAKFIQRRASTPVKTAVTDLATTAIAAGSSPTAAKLSTTAARTAAPTPIVRTIKGSTMRTPPRAPSPDPWKGSSPTGSRIKDVTKTSTPKSSSQKALSGAQSLPSLPASPKGGAIVPASPSGKITKASPRSSAITPASPSGKIAKQTQSPTSLRSSTRKVTSPVSAEVKPVTVRDVTPQSQSTKQLRGVEQPTKSLPPSQTSKVQKPKSSTPPSGKGTPGLGRRIKNIVKGGVGAGVAGVAADMAFPAPTAPGTRDTSPKVPSSPKEVKKGETYYDYSTRVGTSARPAARKKVGPKIVGPKLSAAQDFDRAYKTAKDKGGMGSTFNWRGKSYKVY